jgi:hypothetical protein
MVHETSSDGVRSAGPPRSPRRILAVVIGACLSFVLPALVAPTSGRATADPQPFACPPHALLNVPANGWVAAREDLVPKGPVALRLCRYFGRSTALPLALARSQLLTQSALVASLVTEFDALPPFPPLVHCAADDGPRVLALLVYAGGEHVTVALDTTDCHRVTNGNLVRLGSGYADSPSAVVAQRLSTELSKLTAPASGDAHVTGLIRLCGGPAPGRCFTQTATVSVLDRAGDVVATERTSHGRFSFALPPGTYTLVASIGGARRTVALAAGDSKHENILVGIS